VNLEN